MKFTAWPPFTDPKYWYYQHYFKYQNCLLFSFIGIQSQYMHHHIRLWIAALSTSCLHPCEWIATSQLNWTWQWILLHTCHILFQCTTVSEAVNSEALVRAKSYGSWGRMSSCTLFKLLSEDENKAAKGEELILLWILYSLLLWLQHIILCLHFKTK